jgi:hypothetical protein
MDQGQGSKVNDTFLHPNIWQSHTLTAVDSVQRRESLPLSRERIPRDQGTQDNPIELLEMLEAELE